MKNTLLILSLLISINAFSQREKRLEKIKALKIAHITNEVDLSVSEAEKFWPIYNTFNKKLEEIHHLKVDIKRNLTKGETTDDVKQEVQTKLVNEMVRLKKQEAAAIEILVNDLRVFLADGKILKVLRAEESFKHKMLREFEERHKRKYKEQKSNN